MLAATSRMVKGLMTVVWNVGTRVWHARRRAWIVVDSGVGEGVLECRHCLPLMARLGK